MARPCTYPPDMTGMRFTRLLVIRLSHHHYWWCRCDCGIEKVVYYSNLWTQKIKSCGCLKAQLVRERRTTHGETKTGKPSTELIIWRAMMARCFDKQVKAFKDYGGRGITVCERWKNFNFFLQDVGRRPSLGHSIDRYPNNDGNYEPGNVRWATDIEQANNTRANRVMELNGVSNTLMGWARVSGMKHGTFRARIQNGWSLERALSEPVRVR